MKSKKSMWCCRKAVSVFSVLLIAGMILGSGCVRTTIEPEYTPRVTTAQNSDGLVTLSWVTRPGYDYTLLSKAPDSNEWKPVKGSRVFSGSGETITVTDKRNPRAPLPWYSVQADKR